MQYDSFFISENIKLLQFFRFLNILNVTELPEAFLALGTKLRLVLSFFTLREGFYGFEKTIDL